MTTEESREAWQANVGSRKVILIDGALSKDDGTDFDDEDVVGFLALLESRGIGFGGSIGFPTREEATDD